MDLQGAWLQIAREDLDAAGERIAQASHQLLDRSSQAVSLMEQGLRDQVLPRVQQVGEQLSQRTQVMVEQVEQATHHGAEVLEQAASSATQEMSEATAHLVDSAARTQQVLSDSVHQLEQLGDQVAEGTERAIAGVVQHWLSAHPILAWLLGHPGWTLLLLGLFVLLVWTLVSLLGDMSRQLVRETLQLPLRVLRQLLQRVWKSRQPDAAGDQSDAPGAEQRRLQIQRRLLELNTEQTALLKELEALP